MNQVKLTTEEIVQLRPNVVRPKPGPQPLSVFCEKEAAGNGVYAADCMTVLLRGSECAFRCLMCDLWKSTHLGRTPEGAIPAQIRSALANQQRPVDATEASWIKLYNASNFFAPVNVPSADLVEIADLVSSFDRVIVENHPRLVSERVKQFSDRLDGQLEVAMGLETVHPEVLETLNKGMDLRDYKNACDRLADWGIDRRVFVLLRPPGMSESEGLSWCRQSVEFAFEKCGARHVSVIPVRAGNGAIEHLQQIGAFEPPSVRSAETILEEYLHDPRGIVTLDTWEWSHLRDQCARCENSRRERIDAMNLVRSQIALPPMSCDCVRGTEG
ncbi:MAG: radical SAM protein [Planctomycetota bacterium]